MRRSMLILPLTLFVAALGPAGAPAQAPSSHVVQVATEPPGLDLVTSPASAIAAVVHYN
ncbi:MAG: hypothetical protein HY729_00285, partial [Candidatus Rokubacteria bacterium]|nr:hypothetical protein [Candidatus Rokubacteria bacterium]